MSLWKQNKMTYVSEYLLNIKMGKTFVRGKEKKELGELVEKYKKEYENFIMIIIGKNTSQ